MKIKDENDENKELMKTKIMKMNAETDENER